MSVNVSGRQFKTMAFENTPNSTNTGQNVSFVAPEDRTIWGFLGHMTKQPEQLDSDSSASIEWGIDVGQQRSSDPNSAGPDALEDYGGFLSLQGTAGIVRGSGGDNSTNTYVSQFFPEPGFTWREDSPLIVTVDHAGDELAGWAGRIYYTD